MEAFPLFNYFSVPELEHISYNNFSVESELGKGAFGQVHLVHLLEHGSQVSSNKAGKVFARKKCLMKPNEFNDTAILHCQHLSAAICQTTLHPDAPPALTKVWKVCRELDTMYIFSEYCAGTSLDKLSAVSQKQAWSLLHQISCALHFMHMHDLTHNDVKPANIGMLTHADDDGLSVFKLYDYGSVTRRKTNVSVAVSSDFISPEVLQDDDVAPEPCSDVFSFGLTVLAVLTSFVQVSRPVNVEHQLAQSHRHVSPALSNLIMSMVESDSTKRCSLTHVMQIASAKLNEYHTDMECDL
jgi:serine/threonine protein kinase